MAEFKQGESFNEFSATRRQEDVDKQMTEVERKCGLKDFHLVVHFNDQNEVKVHNFIGMCVDDDGRIFFVARGANSTQELLQIAGFNLGHTMELIAKALEMQVSEVMRLIADDKLMDAIEKKKNEGEGGKG